MWAKPANCVVIAVAMGLSGPIAAADTDEPELEFLEYLGSMEAEDDDSWQEFFDAVRIAGSRDADSARGEEKQEDEQEDDHEDS